ncbi:glycine receptor subunit alpha-2-like [Sitodiplosis mosellana]|uniref:glycine receptor subunit alpha-2-like n=1 Tax=Sitodiplosis mosellana TaxID=263140 RepID=UPI002444C32A|nr:glycine receptor subunit alpha-2-like [Sitodiplosis mosellana]
MRSLDIICAIILFKIKMITMTPQSTIQTPYTMDSGYDKNSRPSTSQTDVTIGLYLNRISAVDENNEEISFDVFLQVIWDDKRIHHRNNTIEQKYIELKLEERHKLWVPDLYIRQLREMKVLTLFEEISSLRLYKNSTLVLSLGATIVIKCDMDFVLYPLDVQSCPVDFSSYKYSVKDMSFRWKKENPITFPKDFDEGLFFRLPKYVVSFSTVKEPQTLHYNDVDHSSARLQITLSREVKSYLLENYLPSTLFVSMSWGSFIVVPEIVPGRMVLLVTTLLSLVTMFDTVRNNSPNALELKCIEVWLISCTLFVFLALMEYFIVLFGIRYDKHWRKAKPKTPSVPSHNLTSTAAAATATTNLSQASESDRKPALEQAARAFSTMNKITPETRAKFSTMAAKRREEALINEANCIPPPSSLSQPTLFGNRRRFRNVAENAILYVGSQHGRLDQISLILFPMTFLLFTISYWIIYLNESTKRRTI